MENFDEKIHEIEQIIGYEFNNKELLKQAFIRASYRNEHPDVKDNESLETFGDSVLSSAVLRRIYEEYCNKDCGYFSLNILDEPRKITSYKKNLIESYMEAYHIHRLGLHKYLIMGNGDKKDKIENVLSTQEDLFEAILGAVAVDCEFNNTIIDYTVEKMMNISTYFNEFYEKRFIYDYVDDLIQYLTSKGLKKYLIEDDNLDNDHEYVLKIVINNKVYDYTRSGTNKIEARVKAYEYAINHIKEDLNDTTK